MNKWVSLLPANPPWIMHMSHASVHQSFTCAVTVLLTRYHRRRRWPSFFYKVFPKGLLEIQVLGCTFATSSISVTFKVFDARVTLSQEIPKGIPALGIGEVCREAQA